MNREKEMFLKNEIARLGKEIEDLKRVIGNTPSKYLAYLCNNAPFNAIRYDGEKKALYFSKSRREAWEHLRDSAKYLILRNRTFQAPEDSSYIEPRCASRTRTENLSEEEKEIIAAYLEEAVELFNKYFIKLNEDVLWGTKPYKVVEHD